MLDGICIFLSKIHGLRRSRLTALAEENGLIASSQKLVMFYPHINGFKILHYEQYLSKTAHYQMKDVPYLFLSTKALFIESFSHICFGVSVSF